MITALALLCYYDNLYYLARVVVGSSCSLASSAAGLLSLLAWLYLSDSRLQEQESRVNTRENRRTSSSRGAYRSTVRV